MPHLSAPAARFPLVRGLATVLAACALAAALAVAPAVAHDGRGAEADAVPAVTGGADGGGGGDARGGDDGRREQGRYRGVVTAERLALRTSPSRGADVIRYARRGEVVSIHCKTPGSKVRGNPLWYLLTDGTWAWGAARYIDNIGPAPRWC
ncbi:SH3 domain-containing protein [Streptomyces sp. NRRL F-5650]|uniref:SH3 domain-containing protein n=1 Tax=Streptomyces sp. NRRL F-5650 TaxID=1463868 RepID=UPI0004C9C598|nr:SH3 domain-containing protein [Streptomyces sp. NRRL F-5650]